MIDVQRLLVLREVAHAGSFAGAAAELRRTPSAVSQQIAALERGAGVALVERSTRGVVLTDAGRLLLAAADAVHAELQAAARQLRDLQANGPQTLTVATFASAGESLLAPALTELTTAADNTVDITVIEAEPDDALASLHSGGADLALVYHFHTRQPDSESSGRNSTIHRHRHLQCCALDSGSHQPGRLAVQRRSGRPSQLLGAGDWDRRYKRSHRARSGDHHGRQADWPAGEFDFRRRVGRPGPQPKRRQLSAGAFATVAASGNRCFRALWVNRGKMPDEYLDFPPQQTLNDLNSLATLG